MAERFVIIMAGGRGTRFWPRSRRAMPKQCLAVGSDGVTLIALALQRARDLVDDDHVLVVTGPDMAPAVRAALPDLPPAAFVVEPSPRNTAPCLGLAAVEVARRAGPEAVMMCTSADHLVADPPALAAALRAAAAAAEARRALVTLGIAPDRPETAFGYIELGEPAGEYAGVAVRQVVAFREKPDARTAQGYVEGGRHLWNAGMFAFTARELLAAFREHLPRSAAALDVMLRQPHRTAELWPEMEATSIDYGILERSRGILTVPCDPGWSDVGSWTAMAGVLPPQPGDSHALAAAFLGLDAERCIAYAPGRVVALLGVSDLVVVEADGVLMVARRDRAQEVGRLIEALQARGREDLT